MRLTRTKKFTAVVAVAALGFGVAACGDDDDTSSEDATTEESMAEGDDAAAGEGTIVDVATEAGSFSFLLTAVEAAGLAETLSGEGPFTVLAPTDDAFLDLARTLLGPEATLEDIQAALLEDPEALEYILLSHVISGTVMAADTVALDGQAAAAVSGEELTVGSDGETVTFTTGSSTATVVTADVTASNGVIHVLDSVIVPLSQQ